MMSCHDRLALDAQAKPRARQIRRAGCWLAIAASIGPLCGCSSSPNHYQGLSSSARLTPTTDDSAHVPLAYRAADTNLASYQAVILDPVAIYDGPDAQFDSALRGIGPDGRRRLAAYMQQRFAAGLSTRYALAQSPGQAVMRVHLTLTGGEANVPVLAILTQLSPVSIVINSAMTAADQQESLSGSVTYAVEVRDSMTDKLLCAFIAKQYPWAENPVARLGAYAAAEAGIRKGAAQVVGQIAAVGKTGG